jgi:hypothetical protein
MNRNLGKLLWGAAVSMSFVAGCQTWVPETGQTLPSVNYLDHPPQYIPPSPPYPLPREQKAIADAQAAQQIARPNPAGY